MNKNKRKKIPYNSGFIVLHRKFTDWEWYDDINTKTLFLHLLLMANWKDKKWHGITVKRGQFLTSRDALSKQTGLSIQQTRTAIAKLISTNEVTKNTTPNYTLITVVNYDKYQNYQPTNQPASNQRATNEQPLLNKDNNINNKYICSFENFWDKYPRRVGKTKARSVYNRKASSPLKEKKIMEGLEKYLKKWRVEQTLMEYIPHPTTWLNQERWNDEVEISREVENKNFRKFEKNMAEKKQKEKDKYSQLYTENDEGGLVKLSDVIYRE